MEWDINKAIKPLQEQTNIIPIKLCQFRVAPSHSLLHADLLTSRGIDIDNSTPTLSRGDHFW